jgi:biotin carboxylase
MNKVLILDRQAAVMAMQVCRALARRGYVVDIFGESGSPAFHSRFCSSRLMAPRWDAKERVVETVQNIVEHGAYDAIYACNEDILEIIIPLLGSAPWQALPTSAPSFLRLMMSKNLVLELAQRSGVSVPATLIPESEDQLDAFARELGMPLVIKGEKGESGMNVRVVQRLTDVRAAYRDVRANEASYGGRPALQAFVRGTAYSVGGLFQDGRPLRICAHRKILTYPPDGGWTVKGVTERPPNLLDEAFKVFAALKYTGLGHVEFVREEASGEYKFLELNPRVWGSIGIAQYAGVDLFSAYQRLAEGNSVAPDLSYRTGVGYHRFSGEARFILRRPQRIVGFAIDALNRNVHSDFDWSDLGPHFSRALVFGKLRVGSDRRSVQTATPPQRLDLEGDNS